MNLHAWTEVIVFFAAVLGFAAAFGPYMARVFEGEPHLLGRVLGPLERFLYRACGIDPAEPMDWRQYTAAVLVFKFLSVLVVYAIQRLQGHLPLNLQGFGAVGGHLAFNTAASFVTNTNWQSYGGETTMTTLTQMFALTVQNFVSAVSGIAVLAAFIRGLRGRETSNLGNFWADLTRGTLYVMLPLATVLALALVSQGVVQNFKATATVPLVETLSYEDQGKKQTTQEQSIPLGPAASQVAIKQLGTNGGGYYNVNSAHPLENPTPLSNFLEVWAILAVGAACCTMFGVMVKDRRQGWALLIAMTLILVPLTVFCIHAETSGNPALARLGAASAANMEGKEARFGTVDSAIWASATTAASNGSVNSMHDSFTPLGGLVPMFLLQLSEVIFGGVGSGLYGMLLFVIVAVFVAGLMVGRTPEYLGKKIEPFEMKMASFAVLVPSFLVLVPTAMAVVTAAGKASLGNPGAHGFSEVLYAFSSMGNNNGSAFAGLNANVPFYDIIGGVVMLISRFWIMVPVLALAGSLGKKKLIPAGEGTLPTHTPLFICLLIGVVLIVGALTFVPALALGPIVEHLMMRGA